MRSPAAPIARQALALALGTLLLSGCGGEEQSGNVIDTSTGEARDQIDLKAYAEQRLSGGAITLIDAATPDGTLMPEAHSGPTLGEIRAAESERRRAAALRGADKDEEDDEETPERVTRSAPAPSRPAAEPVLDVEPVAIE
jgi:hypothetical protein